MIEVTFHSDIDAYLQRLDSAVDLAAQETSEFIVAQAQGMVRQETGSLHDTIDAEPMLTESQGGHVTMWSVNAGDTSGGYKGGGKLNDLTGKKAGDPVDYALAQEYGPGEHAPFMTPAAEQGWVEYLQLIEQHINGVSS